MIQTTAVQLWNPLNLSLHRAVATLLCARGPCRGSATAGPSGVLGGGRCNQLRTGAGRVPTRQWQWQGPPHPRCGVISSEQGANRLLHLLLEYLIDLLLQLLPHRFQGLLDLLVQLFLYRLERLIDLLVQLLSDGLEFLLHLLPHSLRHLLLEVFQDRLKGLRNLLL